MWARLVFFMYVEEKSHLLPSELGSGTRRRLQNFHNDTCRFLCTPPKIKKSFCPLSLFPSYTLSFLSFPFLLFDQAFIIDRLGFNLKVSFDFSYSFFLLSYKKT